MKTILFLLTLLCSSTSSFSQWTIVKTEGKNTDERSFVENGDFVLEITLRNESPDTLYVQGIRPEWYMVEAYIKSPKGVVWERQNIGVDQQLEMLPVKAGGEIKLVRRESLKHAGRSMMLTFLMAHSANDQRGSQILVGDFQIPAPPKGEPSASANGASRRR